MDFDKIIKEEDKNIKKTNEVNELKNEAYRLLQQIKKLNKEYNESDIITNKLNKVKENLINGFKEFFQSDNMKNIFLIKENVGSVIVVAESQSYKFSLEPINDFKYSIKVKKSEKEKENSFHIEENEVYSRSQKSSAHMDDRNELQYSFGETTEKGCLIKQIGLLKEDIKRFTEINNTKENVEFVFKLSGNRHSEYKSIEEILKAIPD